MLYRAIAAIRGQHDDAEVVVFFQATHDRSRLAVLSGLLLQAWSVPASDLVIYNITSEIELLQVHAFGAADTGDARLLETGYANGRPLYAQPERTLLLVRPAMLQRLATAQHLAARLAAA